MRYIVYKNGSDSQSGILWSDGKISHKSMLDSLKANRGSIEPMGAGFISIKCGIIECYGKSDSIGIESRGQVDAGIIRSELLLVL